jgi:hypothetical protein
LTEFPPREFAALLLALGPNPRNCTRDFAAALSNRL